MKKNDVVTVEVTDIGIGGEGIGKVDGYTLFIKDAVIGDTVEVKVMKAKKNYGYARLMRIVKESAFRVSAHCPEARRCGGCQIQEMDYRKQLEFKNTKVRNNLIRLGSVEEELLDQIMEPIAGMEEPFRYRNKAQFPIGVDKEGNQIQLVDVLEYHDVNVVENVQKKEQMETISRNIGQILSEREYYIIRKRYGLFGTKECTQREISAELGISRSYVSRIEKKALDKLKKFVVSS